MAGGTRDIQDGVSASPAPHLRNVLIGGFTADRGGSALGIRHLLNTAGGTGTISLDERQGLPLSSPSYLIGHPAGPWAFAISEADASTLTQPVGGPGRQADHACPACRPVAKAPAISR